MSTTPNPSIFARFSRPTTSESVPVTVTVADLEPETTARIVRPGTRKVLITEPHDGVVKAKHLEPGQEVRAFLHGEPKGGVRVVESTERLDEGATVRVTFSSAHPVTDYKAAYRFFVEALVGTPVERIGTVPALVEYQEV